MGKRTTYTPGTFSWVDLATTDAKGAKAFYSELFNWKFEEIPMPDAPPYNMVKFNNMTVAGLFETTPEMNPTNASYWTSYILVENADDIVKKWQAAGGTVHKPAFDVMENGRMAVLQDPTGATVCIWQDRESKGAEWVNHPGGFCWNELNTRDPETATVFFNKVFGWEFQKDDTPNGKYWMITNGGKMNGGLLDMNEKQMPEQVPPHWNVYFTVENIDETFKKATGSGATACTDIVDIPVGRFAVMTDPTGANFTAIQLTEIDD